MVVQSVAAVILLMKNVSVRSGRLMPERALINTILPVAAKNIQPMAKP
jgi:hypothetical protein